MRQKQGMTLIELIIVLAVIAIISAILVPNFLGTTEKARLKSDVQSSIVLQNALDLYNAEQSAAMPKTDAGEIITELSAKGYINKDEAVLQSESAIWKYNTETKKVMVDVTRCDEKIRKTAYNQLNDKEKKQVFGGTDAS